MTDTTVGEALGEALGEKLGDALGEGGVAPTPELLSESGLLQIWKRLLSRKRRLDS